MSDNLFKYWIFKYLLQNFLIFFFLHAFILTHLYNITVYFHLYIYLTAGMVFVGFLAFPIILKDWATPTQPKSFAPPLPPPDQTKYFQNV